MRKITFTLLYFLVSLISQAQFTKVVLPIADGTANIYSADSTIIALVEGGYIVKSGDAGATWAIDSTFKGDILTAIAFADSMFGYIYSTSLVNPFIQTIDGGNTWTNFTDSHIGGGGTCSNICLPDRRRGFLCSYSQTFASFDSLYTCSSVNFGFADVQYTVCTQFINDSVGFIFEDQLGLYLYKTIDSGHNWSMLPGRVPSVGMGWGYMEFVDDTTAFAIGDDGIYKTINGGDTFINVLTFALDEGGPYGNSQRVSFLNKDTGFVLPDGALLKTTDGGNTWTRLDINFQPNEEAYVVGALSSNVIILGTSLGLYITTNGGGIWNGITQIGSSSLTISPNPVTNKLYITTSLTDFSISIYDMTGRILDLPISKNEIDVSALPSGVYCVRIQDSGGSVVRKFVKE